ncbi:hypothetical protein [Streptomyces sp. NPDC002276]
MSHTTYNPQRSAVGVVLDNRPSYVSFGLAWLVVGLLYLAGGAVCRDRLPYVLGTWLALTSSAALFLHGATLYWVLALAGGGHRHHAGGRRSTSR